MDEPKTTLGKLVSGAFSKFREWWDIQRKPVMSEENRESTLEKLRKYSRHNNEKHPKKSVIRNKEFER